MHSETKLFWLNSSGRCDSPRRPPSRCMPHRTIRLTCEERVLQAVVTETSSMTRIVAQHGAALTATTASLNLCDTPVATTTMTQDDLLPSTLCTSVGYPLPGPLPGATPSYIIETGEDGVNNETSSCANTTTTNTTMTTNASPIAPHHTSASQRPRSSTLSDHEGLSGCSEEMNAACVMSTVPFPGDATKWAEVLEKTKAFTAATSSSSSSSCVPGEHSEQQRQRLSTDLFYAMRHCRQSMRGDPLPKSYSDDGAAHTSLNATRTILDFSALTNEVGTLTTVFTMESHEANEEKEEGAKSLRADEERQKEVELVADSVVLAEALELLLAIATSSAELLAHLVRRRESGLLAAIQVSLNVLLDGKPVLIPPCPSLEPSVGSHRPSWCAAPSAPHGETGAAGPTASSQHVDPNTTDTVATSVPATPNAHSVTREYAAHSDAVRCAALRLLLLIVKNPHELVKSLQLSGLLELAAYHLLLPTHDIAVYDSVLELVQLSYRGQLRSWYAHHGAIQHALATVLRRGDVGVACSVKGDAHPPPPPPPQQQQPASAPRDEVGTNGQFVPVAAAGTTMDAVLTKHHDAAACTPSSFHSLSVPLQADSETPSPTPVAGVARASCHPGEDAALFPTSDALLLCTLRCLDGIYRDCDCEAVLVLLASGVVPATVKILLHHRRLKQKAVQVIQRLFAFTATCTAETLADMAFAEGFLPALVSCLKIEDEAAGGRGLVKQALHTLGQLVTPSEGDRLLCEMQERGVYYMALMWLSGTSEHIHSGPPSRRGSGGNTFQTSGTRRPSFAGRTAGISSTATTTAGAAAGARSSVTNRPSNNIIPGDTAPHSATRAPSLSTTTNTLSPVQLEAAELLFALTRHPTSEQHNRCLSSELPLIIASLESMLTGRSGADLREEEVTAMERVLHSVSYVIQSELRMTGTPSYHLCLRSILRAELPRVVVKWSTTPALAATTLPRVALHVLGELFACEGLPLQERVNLLREFDVFGELFRGVRRVMTSCSPCSLSSSSSSALLSPAANAIAARESGSDAVRSAQRNVKLAVLRFARGVLVTATAAFERENGGGGNNGMDDNSSSSSDWCDELEGIPFSHTVPAYQHCPYYCDVVPPLFNSGLVGLAVDELSRWLESGGDLTLPSPSALIVQEALTLLSVLLCGPFVFCRDRARQNRARLQELRVPSTLVRIVNAIHITPPPPPPPPTPQLPGSSRHRGNSGMASPRSTFSASSVSRSPRGGPAAAAAFATPPRTTPPPAPSTLSSGRASPALPTPSSTPSSMPRVVTGPLLLQRASYNAATAAMRGSFDASPSAHYMPAAAAAMLSPYRSSPTPPPPPGATTASPYHSIAAIGLRASPSPRTSVNVTPAALLNESPTSRAEREILELAVQGIAAFLQHSSTLSESYTGIPTDAFAGAHPHDDRRRTLVQHSPHNSQRQRHTPLRTSGFTLHGAAEQRQHSVSHSEAASHSVGSTPSEAHRRRRRSMQEDGVPNEPLVTLNPSPPPPQRTRTHTGRNVASTSSVASPSSSVPAPLVLLGEQRVVLHSPTSLTSDVETTGWCWPRLTSPSPPSPHPLSPSPSPSRPAVVRPQPSPCPIRVHTSYRDGRRGEVRFTHALPTWEEGEGGDGGGSAVAAAVTRPSPPHYATFSPLRSSQRVGESVQVRTATPRTLVAYASSLQATASTEEPGEVISGLQLASLEQYMRTYATGSGGTAGERAVREAFVFVLKKTKELTKSD